MIIKSTDFKNLNSYIEEVKKENPDFANHLEKSGLDTPVKIYKNYDEIFKYFKHYHENCYKSALEFIQKNKKEEEASWLRFRLKKITREEFEKTEHYKKAYIKD
mgnify:CR=1 FL=1